MHIRNERAEDTDIITNIHQQAFKNHPQHAPGSEPCEHRIVELLRSANALSLSQVAEVNGNPVGHIALSPARVGKDIDGWFLLGPIGVLPHYQKQGIGSALMRETIHTMREQNAKGIVLVGDPGFYGYFGFHSLSGLEYPGVPNEYVLALQLGKDAPSGTIAANKAFEDAQNE